MGAVTLVVATHKAAPFPNDPMYKPVHVGAHQSNRDLAIQRDDEGDNISRQNQSYCELTALYWAWKNIDADAIGLNHYRRYFAGTAHPPGGRRGILARTQAEELMDSYDVLLPYPRNYVVETVESHYRNAHHGADLDRLRCIIDRVQPDYRPALDSVMSGRRLSLYNMLLMRREVLDSYCEWLFPLLELFNVDLDVSERDAQQRRVAGYLGERLLNVWALHNSERLRVVRRQVVNSEGEPRLAKGAAMLHRKIKGALT